MGGINDGRGQCDVVVVLNNFPLSPLMSLHQKEYNDVEYPSCKQVPVNIHLESRTEWTFHFHVG